MYKAIFIIPTGEEAELVYPVYNELKNKGYKVSCIETGYLCCGKDTKHPMVSLNEENMDFTSLKCYKTKSMVEILRIENPSVVVVGSDQEYIRRAFIYTANSLGIPTLLLDVAFGSNALRGHWVTMRRTIYRLAYHFINIMRKYSYVMRTVIDLRWSVLAIIKMVLNDIQQAFIIEDARGTYGCTAIAVAGTWEKEVLIERGVNPSNIVVTGNPRMTALLRSKNKNNENELRTKLGIKVTDKIILLHTSAQIEHGRWNHIMRSDFINNVIDSISPLLNKNVRLILRIHPVENLGEYQEIIKNRQEDIVLIKGMNFVDIINMSDVIVFGAYSMMVLESTAMNKPSILLNVFNEVKNLPYEEMGLAVCVYKYSDIKQTVESFLYDNSARNKFLDGTKEFFSKNTEFIDGNATKRTVDLIEKLVLSK